MTNAKQVKTALKIKASDRQMSKLLNELDINYKKVKTQPFITEKHKSRRILFAKNHLKYDWTKTLFVDEASIWTYCQPEFCL